MKVTMLKIKDQKGCFKKQFSCIRQYVHIDKTEIECNRKQECNALEETKLYYMKMAPEVTHFCRTDGKNCKWQILRLMQQIFKMCVCIYIYTYIHAYMEFLLWLSG